MSQTIKKENGIFRTTCVATLLFALTAAGCNQTAYSTNPNQTTASLSLEPSSREIVSGETVTVVARTRDTYGRDAKVKWTTAAGELREEQQGRIARVKFAEPGTYTITASLSINDQVVQSDMVEIRVKPIR